MRTESLLKSFALLICLIFFFSSMFSAVSSSATSQISFTSQYLLSSGSGKATDPNVQALGSYVYVAWTQGSGGILFRENSNYGAQSNWSAIERISPSGGSAQYPLVSDYGSNVYVVWSQTVGSTGLQIFVATSTNHGSTFAAHQVTSGKARSGYITPVIASWGDQVYVSYDNTSDGYAWLSSSSNAGLNWTHPIEADSCPGNGPCPEPQLYAWGTYAYDVSDNGLIETSDSGASWHYVSINGNYNYVREPWIWGYGSNVYVVFETGGSGSNTMFTYSNNNGSTWSDAVNIATTLKDTWNQQVGAYGSNVWLAVQEYPGGSNDKIFVYSSTNSGHSFTGPKQVSSGGESSYPFSIPTSDGQNVFTAWSQKVSSGHWVMQVAYATNSTNWSGPITASSNTSGEAGNNNDVANGAVASSGSVVYVVWQYIDGSTNQIYFSES